MDGLHQSVVEDDEDDEDDDDPLLSIVGESPLLVIPNEENLVRVREMILPLLIQKSDETDML